MRNVFTAAAPALLGLMFAVLAFGQESGAGNEPRDEEKIASVADGSVTEALASWWGFHEEDATAPLQSALDSGVKTLIIDKQSGP